MEGTQNQRISCFIAGVERIGGDGPDHNLYRYSITDGMGTSKSPVRNNAVCPFNDRHKLFGCQFFYFMVQKPALFVMFGHSDFRIDGNRYAGFPGFRKMVSGNVLSLL